MSNPSEEFMIMHSLQQIRFARAWVDCEFTLYQQLCHNREVMLEIQLKQLKDAYRKIKKEQRESSRRANSKTI